MMVGHRTRRFVAFATVLLCATAAGAAASERTAPRDASSLTKVTLGVFPAPATYGGIYAAMAKGYYRAEGIKVEIVPIFGGVDRITATAAGRVDLSLVDVPDVVVAQEEGAAVTIVGVKEALSQIATASLAATGIRTPKDYAGKTLGAFPGSLVADLLPLFARINGFDAGSVRQQTIDFSAFLPSLLSKRVDFVPAFYASNAYVFQAAAREAGEEVRILRWSDYGFRLYGAAFIAGPKLIQTKPNVLRGFLRATFRGYAYGARSPSDIPAIVRRYAPSEDLDAIKVNWRRTIDILVDEHTRKNGLGWIAPEKLRTTRRVMMEAGGKKPRLALSALHTNKFLPGKSVNYTGAR